MRRRRVWSPGDDSSAAAHQGTAFLECDWSTPPLSTHAALLQLSITTLPVQPCFAHMRNYFNKSSTYKGKAALYITYMSTAKKTAKSTGAAKSPGAAGMAQRAIEIDELDGRVVSGSSLQDFDQAPIRATLIGSAHCEVDGIVARGHAPVLGLCRALLAAGYDPRRPLHAYRGDTIALRIRSIREGAAYTVENNRRGTPSFRRWRNPGPARPYQAHAIRTDLSRARHHPKNQPVSLRHDCARIVQSEPNRSEHRPAKDNCRKTRTGRE